MLRVNVLVEGGLVFWEDRVGPLHDFGAFPWIALLRREREMVVPAGGRLEVTRCGTPLKWVRLDSAPFTDRLVRKFRLPVTGWRGQ